MPDSTLLPCFGKFGDAVHNGDDFGQEFSAKPWLSFIIAKRRVKLGLSRLDEPDRHGFLYV